MSANIVRLGLFLLCAVFTLPQSTHAQRAFDHDILKDSFGYDRNSPRSIELRDLDQGCAARDCIQAINNPKYVSAADAAHVADDDTVLAIEWRGYHRAWPTRILDQHEIVNDFIAGTPIAITWCPLCGSAVGVIREINGQVTEFGVSGLLYNSDLVFYDRATETLWDQIEAKGIVGPLTNTELTLVPITVTRWAQWKAAHPDTIVLSPATGFRQDYSKDVYAKYRDSKRLMFSVANKNSDIHPKSVVFGFAIQDQRIAVSERYLDKASGGEITAVGRSFQLARSADGAVTLTDVESAEIYAATRMYWFAWYTFHPSTTLID